MPFAFYDRLSPRRQQVYRKSDRLQSVELPASRRLPPLARAVTDALAAEDRIAVQRACQRLVDEITAQLAVPSITVRVRAQRPSAEWGELHGLYTPDNERPRAMIEVWMRTAKQRRVVASRTFLRTLIHEVCHHLDYELYALAETFHTEGFYRRESSLMKQLLPQPAEGSPKGARSRGAGSAEGPPPDQLA